MKTYHIAELEAENARLRAALEAVEWALDGLGDYRCPWCGAWRSDDHGHRPDCQRQLALGITEKEEA